MKVCIFFGHSDCYSDLKLLLYEKIEHLILRESVDTFYVGNHGQFDAQVHSVLKEIQKKYPISYSVVLAYLPGNKNEYRDYSDAIFPEGMEAGPPRFAIDRRNRWMLAQADYVIAYVRHPWGGAAKYTAMAERRGIPVMNAAQRASQPEFDGNGQ